LCRQKAGQTKTGHRVNQNQPPAHKPGRHPQAWRRPAKRIVAGVRQRVPGARIIGFPRGAGTSLKPYVDSVDVDAVGLDWMIDRGFARDEIQRRRPVQGNLDPLALLAGGAALDREVDAILEAFADRPFIFNLGHGILPETPITHVERMIARVRGRSSGGSTP
jgi:uroporphyrinogen decarboxylase